MASNYTRQPPSGQSRVYRVMQVRTDRVHCRESAGTGPVNLKVVRVTVAAFQVSPWTIFCLPLLSHIHYFYGIYVYRYVSIYLCTRYVCRAMYFFIFLFFYFFHLTYSRWTSLLPSCLWSQRIFPSLPGSRLTGFYRDASSALLQLVNQWLNFTYSRSHVFRYERKNLRIELTTSVLADVQLTY